MCRSREIGRKGFPDRVITALGPKAKALARQKKEEERTNERKKKHTQIAHFVGQIVIRRFIFLFFFFVFFTIESLLLTVTCVTPSTLL
jgi:hypothetical protein